MIVPTLPAGAPANLGNARPLAAIIDAPAWLRGTVDALCDGTYVVETPEEARVLSSRHAEATLLRAADASSSSRSVPSCDSGDAAALALQSAIEKAEQGLRRVESERNAGQQNADRQKREVERIDRELRGARSEPAR